MPAFTRQPAPREAGVAKVEVTLTTDAEGLKARSADCKLLDNWCNPLTLAIVGAGGYLDWQGDHEKAYEPGCKLYIDDKGQLVVLKAN